jgi:hypothetical protein
MSTSWSEVIENPDERKVFESLADPHWDYRTVDGIQKASGLPPEKVQDILHKYEAGPRALYLANGPGGCAGNST